jgi:2,3-bisphosphoglycerate-independent phosphoglycerate mutase
MGKAMANETVEQRVAILEKEVAQLKRRLDQVAPLKNWLDRVAGSMKEYPEFAEVLKHGAAIRQADQLPEDP